jgi:hypothetical protein
MGMVGVKRWTNPVINLVSPSTDNPPFLRLAPMRCRSRRVGGRRDLNHHAIGPFLGDVTVPGRRDL